MALQDDIEAVEDRIAETDAVLKGAASGASARNARHDMRELRDTHQTLTRQVEALYDQLDVGELFPHIRGYGYEFARTLVMLYDAKCIVRQKVTGRFFEYAKLDRAVGGRDNPLGRRYSRFATSVYNSCRNEGASAYHEGIAAPISRPCPRHPEVQRPPAAFARSAPRWRGLPNPRGALRGAGRLARRPVAPRGCLDVNGRYGGQALVDGCYRPPGNTRSASPRPLR